MYRCGLHLLQGECIEAAQVNQEPSGQSTWPSAKNMDVEEKSKQKSAGKSPFYIVQYLTEEQVSISEN